MKKTAKGLILSIILLVQAFAANAQIDKEFWFCVPQLTSQHESDVPKLVITAHHTAKVKIDMPLDSRFGTINKTITAGHSEIIQLNFSNYPTNGSQENNILESGLYGESCIVTNKGIHITSDSLISVYLERGVTQNDDIWALKGKNAFGRYFIVPSQTDFMNHNFNHAIDGNSDDKKQKNEIKYRDIFSTALDQTHPNAWNSIDIVAIEDMGEKTTVTVTLQKNGDELVEGWPNPGSKTATFEMSRGQTLSLQAKSQGATKHLGGTIIESNGFVAVQWKDDSLRYEEDEDNRPSGEGGCYDVIGDQLVPLVNWKGNDLVGDEYIVMRGQLGEGGYKKSEYAYFIATEDGTTTVKMTSDNNEVLPNITLTKKGQIKHFRLNDKQIGLGDKNYNALHVTSDKPIIVMHMAGFGCEVGGAILPTIKGCSGSPSVSVCRSHADGCFLNIMCKVAHKGDFTINVNGTDYRIPASWFKDIPNTGWCYLKRERVKFSATNSYDGVSIPEVTTGSVVKVTNSSGLFHLATINGGTSTGCRYGYFSNFEDDSGSAFINLDDDGSQSEYSRCCVGDIVQLSASGGSKYLWKHKDKTTGVLNNETFLSDAETEKEEPQVTPLEGFNEYHVQIWRRCYYGNNVDTTIQVWALGYPRINADFKDEQGSKCSPSQVIVTNKTDDKDMVVDHVWKLYDGETTTVTKGREYGDGTLTLENNTTDVITYHLTLETSISSNCRSRYEKSFPVCPTVDATLQFRSDANSHTLSNNQPANRCQPLDVYFGATLKGPYTHVYIDYGDGTQEDFMETNPNLRTTNEYQREFEHTYNNFRLTDTIYTAKIRIVSETNVNGEIIYCEDESEIEVNVNGYVKAQYVIDNAAACSPLTTTFTNNSIGEASRMTYSWSYGTPSSGTASPANSTAPFTLTYKNNGSAPIIYRNVGLKETRKSTVGEDCSDSQQRDSLVIYPKFTVDYTVDPYVRINDNNIIESRGCNPTTIKFENKSSDKSDATHFKWYFGDGTSEKGKDPIEHLYSHTEPGVKNYKTSLAGESQWGCRDSVSKAEVFIMPYLNPNFTIDNASDCSPMRVKIKNNTPAHAYKDGQTWNIDYPYTLISGNLNSEAVLEFENKSGSKKTITITLTDTYVDSQNNNKTCSESFTREIEIMPEIDVQISSDKSSMCDNTEVTFTNGTKFTGSNASPTDYLWVFGDGTSKISNSNAEEKHTYRNNDGSNGTAAKRFTASLTASANGCSYTKTTPIDVYPKITADFSYVKATECYSAQDNVVSSITNNSLNANKFEWDFNSDGTIDETKTDKATFNHNYVNSSADGNSISTYTITLKAINSNNESCYDIATKTIDIYPKVIAAFETANAEGCSPLTTSFTNNSKGYGLTYKWEYDHDNLQSAVTDATHSHTFDNVAASTRTYNVKLTVTDINNCKSEISKPVKAYPHVVADFTYVKDEVCTPYPVTFSYPAAALNGTEFVWDFGYDGNTATRTDKQPFKFTFYNSEPNSVKTYNIKLTSTDLNTGCTDNITKPIEVYPQLKPAFTQDVTEGCNPLTVQFTNQTTGLADYLWDFGDSQSSAETSPKHVFKHFKLTDQTYNVKLTTTQTATGCVKEVSQPIVTYSYVQAKFGINETTDGANGAAAAVLGGCTPFDVTITDSSKLTNAGTWYWDFGDGTTSDTRQPNSRVYTNDDNDYPLENKPYTIYLKVTNDHGCSHDTAQTIAVYPRSVPDFDGNFTGCEPLTVEFVDKSIVDSKTQYLWSFSDGSTIVDKPPFSKVFHNYDYENNKKFTVNLKTTTEYNCTDEITKEIEVYAKPLARFIPLIDRACPPFDAEFMNTSIGTDLTYNWNFDNGKTTSTTSKDNQTVEYTNDTDEPITFNVELMVESGLGCRDTMVNPMITFPNVIVDFSFDTAGCSPHTIKIENLSTKTTTNHLFDFGEGSTSVADEPTFTYYNTTDNDQVLTITYIGSSKYQCTDTIKKNVTVYINPNVDFVAHTPSQRYPDDTVYFENYTQDGPWTYQWDFGDGKTLRTDEKYFMYKYGKWGANKDNNIFHVTLHVETEHCENTMTHDVIILPPYPRIEILNQKPAGCVPLTVQFRINQEYCNTFEWNFEDGSTSKEPEPVHEFTEPGIYNVKLTAQGDGGEHYDYEIITVYELPQPDFTTSPQYVMLPDQPVQFFNSTRNGNTYIWDFGDGEYSTELNPYHQYTKEGFYDVKLIAFSSQMCTDSIIKYQDVEVSGAGYIKYPNAFLPSDESPLDGTYPVPDDVNNVFHPVWHGVKEYDLWIFNRWGEQLFHSTDVNVGWNGKYANNGTELGQDVYFWKAKGKFENNVPFKIAGDVTLIRK